MVEPKEQKKKKTVRVMPAHKGKILTVIACAASLSACSAGTGLSWYGGDFFEVRGTPEGIEAWDTYQSGMITNSRIDNVEKSPHWTVKSQREEYRKMLLQSKKAR